MRRIDGVLAPAALVLAFAWAHAPPLAAQEPADTAREPVDTAAAAADTVTPIPLDPITVTVLRRPAELLDVPYAVGVKTESELARAGAGLGLEQALAGVPGVQVDNRYNYSLGDRISIRGFGARAQFGVRGVKVLVDGIPATLADGQTALTHVDPRELGRVEVVRGPAAALYGNAAGGVIRLRTTAPRAGTLTPSLTTVTGENGLLRLTSALGGRTAAADYRVAVSRFSYDGHREFGDAERTYASAAAGYETDRDRLRIISHFVDSEARNPGSLSAEQLAEDRTQAHGFNVVQRTGETVRHGQFGVSWAHGGRHSADAGELRVAAYGLARSLDNPIPPVIIELERRAAGARASYRDGLPIGDRTLEWTVGADADLQRDDRRNFVNDGGDRGGLVLDQFETVRSLAAFGQIAAPLTTRAALLAALRYDRFRFAADDRFITADDPDDSGERALDALSPSLGLRFAVADGVNLYGNVATAFETPTTTELANRPSGAGGFNPELEPQRTLSFEAGAKGRVGGRLAFQVAAYRAAVRDALIPFQVPEVQGRDFFRNAGSAVHRGVELGAWARLVGALSVRAAYTYTDARFDDYASDAGVFDGNRVPGVAPHRLDAVVAYRPPSGWFLELDARYASEMMVDDANTAASPAYTVFDLRGGGAPTALGGTELEPFVGIDNLFDAKYNSAVTVNAFGRRYYEPAPGRQLHAGVEVRFGVQ